MKTSWFFPTKLILWTDGSSTKYNLQSVIKVNPYPEYNLKIYTLNIKNMALPGIFTWS